MTLWAYTDGSGTVATKPCGCGVVIVDASEPMDPEIVAECSLHLGLGTNNRAELSGIGLALKVTSCWADRPLVIYSDSTYALGMVFEWSLREEQANFKLALRCRQLCEGRIVEGRHVKGHAGNFYNERADWLAGRARKAVPGW